MSTRDYLIKAMDKGNNLRLFLARTTQLVEEAQQRHKTSATASAALGRVMTAAVMMASDLKGEEDILTIRVNGNGPAGTIVATADSAGGVRGLVANPAADLPEAAPGKLAVGDLVGKDGFVEVIKDLGLKQPFSGQVPLVSGEIAEDIAQYFMISEQTPALVSLGVLVNPNLSIQAAGGLFIQALPDASDEVLEMVEKNIVGLGPISSLIDNYLTLEEIMPLIMRGVDYQIVDEMDLSFRCSCNRERLQKVLSNFSPGELGEMAVEEEIELICNFCRERYLFKAEDIKPE
jgi:molecular chaperone Hsp33